LHFPEMIALMGDPEYSHLVDAIMADEAQRLWLLGYTAQRFGGRFGDPDGLGAVSVLPQFFGAPGNPIALEEIRAWTAHLPHALDTQDQAVTAGKLRHLEMPAIVAFGADDPYLTPALGRHVASLFTNPTVHDIPHASHWPQWDQPQAVAHLINNTPG
jgi:haloalkane dehalogenase